ncbi:MAG: type II toxin-antitoxin system HicB family antitoxin [Lactobacillaceae bacterium]|jgi:predicted RNase H-like HicB family nuclease|nr:type II toxin-antitoxin system HicB family antitoxin [Lactobacillaceae bacterium]
MTIKNMKYVYYATLYDDGDAVGVKFVDFPSVFTFGNDELDAIDMAQEALELYLWTAEDKGIPIPAFTHAKDITEKAGERLIAIKVNTALVREQEANKLVKKTLTIPAYVDRIAREAGINFSQALTEALKQKLVI